MTKWSFKARVSLRNDRRNKMKSDVLPISDMEALHKIYVCDLQLEQQACALSKLEDYFDIDEELVDIFRHFFSFMESDITFEIFTFYLWNFCSMLESDLASFIFGLYAPKGSETICRSHLIELLKAFNNDEYENTECILPHVQ